MKAITIRQPWAELIVSGRRIYEIRSWKIECPQRLLVHSGKRIDAEACKRLQIDPNRLHVGEILGVVCVVECKRFTRESWKASRTDHLEWLDYDESMYGWFLREPRAFEKPIPWRGSLGLFEVPNEEITGNYGACNPSYGDIRGLPNESQDRR